MALAIQAENISKRYQLGEINSRHLAENLRRFVARLSGKKISSDENQFWALRNVSFTIPQGQSVGIIGENGAGKSTLLKILSRITLPTTGKATLYGRIGSLLEVGTGFNNELTGRENIFLNASILGIKPQEVEKRLDQIVEFSGVGNFIDTPVKRYSSGMRVRLAFAVASYVDLDILLLDEVLAVGDIAFRKKCYDRMQHLMDEGRTILFVSHDLASTVRFCTRVIWLEKGQIVFDGPAEEGCDLYRRKQMENARGSDSKPGPDGIYRYSPNRPLPDEAPPWRVHSFSIHRADGTVTDSLRLGEPCEFRIGMQSPTPAEIPCPRFVVLAFNDENGRRVFALRSDIAGIPDHQLPPQSTLRFSLPKLPLLPGHYTALVRLSAQDKTTDILHAAAEFHVYDGAFYPSQITPNRALTPLCIEGTAHLL